MWLAIWQRFTVEEDQGAGFVCVGQPLVSAGNSGLHSLTLTTTPSAVKREGLTAFGGT